jgi:hypothetical protein
VGSAALICQEALDAPLRERRLQLFHDAQPNGINQHPDITLMIRCNQANAARPARACRGGKTDFR